MWIKRSRGFWSRSTTAAALVLTALACIVLLAGRPLPASATDVGNEYVTRWADIPGDASVGALRADVEYSDPHVKAQANEESDIYLGYGYSDSARIITIGYRKLASGHAKWLGQCLGCGLTGDDRFSFCGPVVKYRTRIGIYLIRASCPDQSSCIYKIHFYVDGSLCDLKTVTLSDPKEQPSIGFAGGYMQHDDETDVGVAGLLDVEQMLNNWMDIDSWVPSNTEPVINHFNNRYFSAYWTSGPNGSGNTNLQVYSNCHLTSNCTYP